MPRPCPEIPGYTCPIMPGMDCPELPGGRPDAKLAQCRLYAMRDGFLVYTASGRFDRKEGWREGEGPEWRRT